MLLPLKPNGCGGHKFNGGKSRKFTFFLLLLSSVKLEVMCTAERKETLGKSEMLRQWRRFE